MLPLFVRSVAAAGLVFVLTQSPHIVDATNPKPQAAAPPSDYLYSSAPRSNLGSSRNIDLTSEMAEVALLGELTKMRGDFDSEQYLYAKSSILDAKKLLGMISNNRRPFLDITADGLAYLRWSGTGKDMIVLVSGDSRAFVSVASANESFLQNAIEVSLDEGSAKLINAKLQQIYL